MKRWHEPRSRVGQSAAATPGDPAALDAGTIVARITADERAADAARDKYVASPMAALPPDAMIATVLQPDEVVLAIRPCAVLDHRRAGLEPHAEPDRPADLAGALYVTSRRLLLLGAADLSVELAEIGEAVLSGERLLLALRDGQGISIETSQPRLLRVEIATARVAART